MLALDSPPEKKDSADAVFALPPEAQNTEPILLNWRIPVKESFVMAEKKPQTFANHTRLDPLFHFFVLPIFSLSTVAAIVLFLRHPDLHSAWRFVLIAAATIAVFKVRLYTLRVQDRVIRLEERLRLALLLPEPLRPRIPELTESQLIALRFASDAELPNLTERALAEKSSAADIKKSIQVWRPDYWRV
jgi:Family of unknown function (DUF6526)